MDSDVLVPVPLPLHTIHIAYVELGNSVRVSLRTQIGDAARLNVSKHDCLRFLATVDQLSVEDSFLLQRR